MPLKDVLEILANTLQVQRLSDSASIPGEPVHLRLVPSITGLSVTDVALAPVNLTFLTKNVRFNNALLEPEPITSVTPAGGTPLNLPAADVPAADVVPLSDVVTTTADGLLGQIAGTIPIPATLPVSVEVSWHVFDDRGRDVTESVAAQGSAVSDSDIPGGIIQPGVALIFPVQTVELTLDAPVPAPKIYFVEASVKLQCASPFATIAKTDWIKLPRLPIPVPVVGIPTIVALFQHAPFHGFVVVIVPSNSPLAFLGGQEAEAARSELTSVLRTLRSTVQGLAHLPSFASFLLGLNQLTDVIPSAPHFRFVPAAGAEDGVRNLREVDMGYSDDVGANTGDDTRVKASDRITSLILVGPEGRSVELLNEAGYDNKFGAFRVTVGPELFVLVRDLRRLTNGTPDSVPGGRCLVTHEPVVIFKLHIRDEFNDRCRSLRFRRILTLPPVWPPGMGMALEAPTTNRRGRSSAKLRGRSKVRRS